MNSERAREWLAGGGFFDWSPPVGGGLSLRIFHAEFGDPQAPVLALVHGFPTSSIDWYDVIDALSGERRVCVLDFPGFGFSDKPKGERYTIDRDSELLGHYLLEELGVDAGAIAAHDRGDSVALSFAARCGSGTTPFTIDRLVLANGNMFLPLSNLRRFQRVVLDPDSAPRTLAALTPEALAGGLGEHFFTPPRSIEDPAISALADTFACNDGISVLHDTIQYLRERSERETEWLQEFARLPVPTTLVWGLYDTTSPLRAAAHIWSTYLLGKPGENEFWLLPCANHYLQHDQPAEFAEVVKVALARRSPAAPGPLSDAAGAPILIDRSRPQMPTARQVLEAT